MIYDVAVIGGGVSGASTAWQLSHYQLKTGESADAPFPKARIENLLNRLYLMRVTLPVVRGSVILRDAEGTGINVIASEDAK